jgi:hypothetical protein
MSRDAVFVRVAPSTFALQSVITHQRRLLARHEQRTPGPKESSVALTLAADANPSSTADKLPDGREATTPGAKDAQEEEAEYSDDDVEDEDVDAAAGGREPQAEPWLQAFLTTDYDSLSLADRIGALSFLVGLVINGPTVRAKLDERSDQGARLKRSLLEEVKVCLKALRLTCCTYVLYICVVHLCENHIT